VQEEYNRPLEMTALDLWRKGAALKGRTVVFKAKATCVVFENGTMLVKFYDPKMPNRLLAQGMVDRVNPAWKLDVGPNLRLNVNFLAVVERVVDGGLVQLTHCRVLGLE
jgi:hypothetical protein